MNEPKNSSLLFDAQAKHDFERALNKGFWRSFWSWFRQSNNRLMSYDDIRKALPVRGQHDIGMQVILLDKVVGSTGRYQDFDRAFLPRNQFLRGRWVSIDRAHLQDIVLPPIEVYKIGEVYFVRDGNHRVSVARERKQAFIDAYVTEIDCPVPLTPETNVDELIRQVERSQFFGQTHLITLRPNSHIELTLPGGFDKLLEHIDVHRYFMGEQRKAEVPYAEAVGDWYDQVYLPLVHVIDCQSILKQFPKRTETDLYLWIIEHLWYLRQDQADEVSLEQAASDYTRQFAAQTGPFHWLVDLMDWATHQHKGEQSSSNPPTSGTGRKPPSAGEE